MPDASDVFESKPYLKREKLSESESENSELEIEHSEDSEQSESEQVKLEHTEQKQLDIKIEDSPSEQSEEAIESEAESADDSDSDEEDGDGDSAEEEIEAQEEEVLEEDSSDGSDGDNEEEEDDDDDDDDADSNEDSQTTRKRQPVSSDEEDEPLERRIQRQKRAKRNHWTGEEKARLFEKLQHGRASLVEITKHVGPGKSLRHIAEYIEHMQFWSNRLGPVHPDGQNDSDEDDASREVEVVLNPQLLLREDKTILEHVHREERVMVPHIMQMIQDIDSDNGDRGEIVDHPAVHMFHRKMVDNLATMFYKETPYALSPALYTDMAGELEKFLRRIIARLITKLMVKGRVYPEEDGLPQLETSKLDVRLAIRDEGFGDKLRMSVAQDRIRRFYDTHRYRQSFALTTNKRRSGNLNINPDWFESTTEYNYADGDGSVALRDFIIDDDPVYKCAAPSSRYDDDDDDDHDDSETSDDDASPDSSDGD